MTLAHAVLNRVHLRRSQRDHRRVRLNQHAALIPVETCIDTGHAHTRLRADAPLALRANDHVLRARVLRPDLGQPFDELIERHAPSPALTPVLPNPPSPRGVACSPWEGTKTVRMACPNTIWAIRSPGLTTKGLSPRLARMTPMSPR